MNGGAEGFCVCPGVNQGSSNSVDLFLLTWNLICRNCSIQ